jgi:hypothetical protein
MKLQKATTKEDKKNILPWNTKAKPNAEFRITFNRKAADGPPDSAFYLENREEVRTGYTLLII